MPNGVSKISVIVPVYQAEKYLRECLFSLCDQSYQNLEILLVYTACSDASWNICCEFAAHDKRIVLLKNNTDIRGPGISRNIGLEHSTGQLIGFVDADDVVAKNMYEVLYNNMMVFNTDISICSETRNKAELINKEYSKKAKLFSNKKALKKMIEGKLFHVELWNKLYRLDCVKGIRFINTGPGEDVLYNWTAFQKAERVVWTNEQFYFYRLNSNGITKNYKKEHITQKVSIYSGIAKEIQSKYPKLQSVIESRQVIINAQNFLSYKLSSGHDAEFDIKLRAARGGVKFRCYFGGFPYREKAIAVLFQLSPELVELVYRKYSALKCKE